MSSDRPLYEGEIRKAYKKHALLLHPDKNPEPEAKQRFQDLQRVYSILSDEEKRKVYDDTGLTGEEGEGEGGASAEAMAERFRAFYKKVTPEDILETERAYRGSAEERADVLRFYTQFEGNMKKVFDWVMCSEPKYDEHRYKELVEGAVKQGAAEAFPAFKPWAKRVAKKAPPPGDPLLKGEARGEGGDMSALVAAIRKRGAPEGASFFESLEAKYCGAGAAPGGSTKAGRPGVKRKGRCAAQPEDASEDGGEGASEAQPKGGSGAGAEGGKKRSRRKGGEGKAEAAGQPKSPKRPGKRTKA